MPTQPPQQSDRGIDALLLVTPSCPYCAATKLILNKLLNEGLLTRVDIVDVSKRPEIAREYDVKTVPWLKMGPSVLRGAQSESILREWLEQPNPAVPQTRLIEHLLQTDELAQVIALVERQPSLLVDMIPLLGDIELDLKIRLGISAVIENFEGLPLLNPLVQPLTELAHHEHAGVRADAAHYLAITHSPDAVPILQQLVQDNDSDVREIAAEGLTQ